MKRVFINPEMNVKVFINHIGMLNESVISNTELVGQQLEIKLNQAQSTGIGTQTIKLDWDE